MSKLAHWCFAHRGRVLAGWLVALVVILGVSQAVGTNYNLNFSLPNTDSQAAIDLLKANFKSVSGESDQVVLQTTGGQSVHSPQVRAAFAGALQRVEKVPDIAGVVSPYSTAGVGQVSKDGRVAFATVTWKKGAASVTKDDAKHLIAAATSADSANLHVYLGGNSIENQESSSPGVSVLVGVIAALIVLLIVFSGAVVASLMPLVSTGLSLILGTALIGLLSQVMGVPSVSTDLAVLIGLGVGVDYGLFIISRHRAGVMAGMSYEDAVVQAVTTSGRTVLFAGATVCIALLGQLALGVGFLNGMSIASAIAVALTMASSLTFLPAVLGILGPRVLSRRERRALAQGPRATDLSPFWLRWAGVLRRASVPATIAAALIVVACASPILSLRLGNPDASADPASSTTHKAYETLAAGFGPGFNGPLEIAAHINRPGDSAAFTRLVAKIGHEPGVASVGPASTSPNGKAMFAIAYPSTSPQAKQTVTLVNHLRDDLIPPASHGTGMVVHVGGATATNIDFSHELTDKLPVFIAVVVVLAFILLTAVFRSLLIPLVAAIMNLLSIGAALGALNAVFNLGWGKSVIGLTTTTPIAAFLPVLMFSVLFGLSMDYEVYLVSRMQEEWHRLREGGAPAGAPPERHDGSPVANNHAAIVGGHALSGRVITAAAGIMVLVFGSFLLGNNQNLKQFGFGLGFSVLVDAFVIRSIFVPAVMHLIGPRNWAMPAWLDRILPNLSVEAPETEPTSA